MPKMLYLQKEFCGLDAGTEFRFVASAFGECYSHEGFVVPAEEATENEEWFGAEVPAAEMAIED